MSKYKIALIIVGAGMALELLGLIFGSITDLNFFQNVIIFGWVLTLIAYLFGGLKIACHMILTGAKWCFMLGLIGGFVTIAFVFSITSVVIIFFPIIPVFLAYRKYELQGLSD